MFLSPPWGGLEYKNAHDYSLRKMVTPKIENIVKQSLKIGDVLMFYLARSINISELFDIIYEETKSDFIFLDTYILESANKTKAILLIYGNNPNLENLIDDFTSFFSLINQNELKLLETLERHDIKRNKLEQELDCLRTVITLSKNNFNILNKSIESKFNDLSISNNESFNNINTNKSLLLTHSKSNLKNSKRKLSHQTEYSNNKKLNKRLENCNQESNKNISLDYYPSNINLLSYNSKSYNISVKKPDKILTPDTRSKEELIKILEVIDIKEFCNILLKYKEKLISKIIKNNKTSKQEELKLRNLNITNLFSGKTNLKEIVNFFYCDNLDKKHLDKLLCSKI